MTPSTQKHTERPISFLLFDDLSGQVVAEHDLIIRPEDLTRREPGRLTEHQALDGVWVDDFGPGVTLIEISGHTGWRGGATADGIAIFQKLHQTIFRAWYKQRQAFAGIGKDPDRLQMILNDELNQFSEVVAPKHFVLKRNKSRPLLTQYQISLVVVGDVATTAAIARDSIVEAVQNPYGRYTQATDSLSNTIKKQQAIADSVNQALGDITGVSTKILNKSNELLQTVVNAGTEVVGVFDAATAPLLYTSMAINQAARNAYQILSVPYGITQHARYTLMQIASNFNEAYCTLRNGFNLLQRVLDIEDFFGASNCSSTGGGRPLSPLTFQNPFFDLYRSNNLPLTVTPSAVNAITFLQRDIQSVTDTTDIPEALAVIAEGVTLA